MSEKKQKKQRNGKLKIELDVEDALKAALETRPPPVKKARKKSHPRKRLDGG